MENRTGPLISAVQDHFARAWELRHIQHHLGAISAELKRRGITPFKRWD